MNIERDERYDQAVVSIGRAIEKIRSCSEEEKGHLRDDLRDLVSMQAKLAKASIEIVIFGEISTGKSALVNALVGEVVRDVDVRGGWTKEVWQVPWEGSGYCVPGFGDSQLVLIDTPGLNEVGGEARVNMARAVAQRADLILFVTDSDLNDVEFSAFLDLAGAHKPIILVFNKIDNYSPEDRERLLGVLRDERLNGILEKSDVIMSAANPRKVQFVIESPDGTSRSEWRQPTADVGSLKARILEILNREGLGLLALNAAMYAVDKSDRIGALRIRMRDEAAQNVIWRYAVLKGVGVSLNPVPFVDTTSGFAIDATLVGHLARIYGLELNCAHAGTLVKSIMKSAGMVGAAEISFHLLCGTLKAITLGHATAFTALPQGGLAAYGSYIVGNSAKCYFEQGASWGPEGSKNVVTRILDQVDKDSVVHRFKDEIKKKLITNPHSSESV